MNSLKDCLMIKKIFVGAIILIAVLGWVSYFLKQGEDTSIYKDEIKSLDVQIMQKDSIILSTQKERDLLKIEAKVMYKLIDTLSTYRVKYDSLRGIVKDESNESHKRIDNASLDKLSGIISGYIE